MVVISIDSSVIDFCTIMYLSFSKFDMNGAFRIILQYNGIIRKVYISKKHEKVENPGSTWAQNPL